jgi:hypothetical protein
MLTLLLASAMAVPVSAQDATQEADAESEVSPQLPAVDLPTMNSLGYSFELESTFEGNPNSTPRELPVYQFEPLSYSEEEVTAIADTLDIDGELTSQGEDTFSVVGNGSIFTTPGLLQFVSDVVAPEEDLPSEEESIAFAREWLRETSLLPANVSDGEIITRIESPPRYVIGFKPTSPSPLLSSTPGITVTLGPGGAVLETRISWATITRGETFQLRNVDDAFSQVSSRQSYVDVTLPQEDFPQGTTVTGNATYDSVSIVYSTSGVEGERQFIQPVYVFSGQFSPADSDETYDIVSYVPAIITGLQPVG